MTVQEGLFPSFMKERTHAPRYKGPTKGPFLHTNGSADCTFLANPLPCRLTTVVNLDGLGNTSFKGPPICLTQHRLRHKAGRD